MAILDEIDSGGWAHPVGVGSEPGLLVAGCCCGAAGAVLPPPWLPLLPFWWADMRGAGTYSSAPKPQPMLSFPCCPPLRCAGLDIDALRDVSAAVNGLKATRPEMGILMVTHYKASHAGPAAAVWTLLLLNAAAAVS